MSDDGALPSEAKIVQLLRASSRGPLKPKDIARGLDIPTDDYKAFRALLATMEAGGRVYRVKGGRYAAPDKINLVAGKLSTIRSGDGFVAAQPGHKDVFVPAADLGNA